MCVHQGRCGYARSLGPVSGSEPVDVLIVIVTPGAPECLGTWLFQPPDAGRLVKGHMTVGVFVCVKLCPGFLTSGSSGSLVESPKR